METRIQIFNDYSFIITKDEKVLLFLWQKLRFRQKDYFHNRRYKQKLWDGFVDFFDKKKGKFLTGLLPEVKSVLNFLKVEFVIEDKRTNVPLEFNSIDNSFFNNYLKFDKDIILEDYQVDFVNLSLKHKRGIIQAQTASGKDFCIIALIKCIKEGIPILFLGNRKGITYKIYKQLIDCGIKNVGRFDGEKKEPNIITCATIQSLHHLEKDLSKFKVLIIDEAHTMMSNTCIKAYKKLKNCSIRIALSATPFKFNETDKVQKFSLKGFFGPVFKTNVIEGGKLTVEYLQEKGRLSKAICHFYPINEPQIPYDIYIDAVTNGIEQNCYLHQIVRKLALSLKGRTLILVERIAHGDYLNQLIPNSRWIYGKDNLNTREEVIESLKYEKDNFIAIASKGIFSTGVNFFAHNFINTCDISATHLTLQTIGRGLRPANDKDILNYYDFVYTINPYLEKHSRERIKILSLDHQVIVYENINF